MDEIIRKAEYKDLNTVKRMTDTYIGRNFYTFSELKEILEDDNKYLYVYVDERDRVVAYLYSFVETPDSALNILHVPCDVHILPDIAPDERVGVYKTACTEEKKRGQGIMTMILNRMQEEMRRRNVSRILFTALQAPDGNVPAHKVGINAGFLPAAAVSHPWIHIDSYCPYCKKRYCCCNAVLYVKEIKD